MLTEAARLKDSVFLRVNDLQGFYGESHVLHGMTFHVSWGEVVTLLGRNGAGKTTTMKAIMGLLAHRQGSIQVAGKEPSVLPLTRLPDLELRYVRKTGASFLPSRSKKTFCCLPSCILAV